MRYQTATPKPRRFLNTDALIQLLRRRFSDIKDRRASENITYSLVDTLMAAFAMFSLKSPSLLAFEKQTEEPFIRKLYGLANIPRDSTMREILDGIEIEPLNQAFADIFHELQRGGILKQFEFHDGHYLLLMDGTGNFGSTKISCP